MSRNRAILTVLLCGCVAHAQELTFDDRKAVLEAQTELMQKELALQNAQRQLMGPLAAGLPSVLAIMGVEGRMAARLQQSNGVVGIYGEGETIRPGLAIASITTKLVTVKVGTGKTTRAVPLEFAAGAQNAGLPGMPPGAPGTGLPPELLPPPPPIRILPPRPTGSGAPAAAAPAPSNATANSGQPVKQSAQPAEPKSPPLASPKT